MLALKVLLGASLALQLGMGVASGDELGVHEFFNLPRGKRVDKFETLDLPAQYQLYVYGVRNIEPPSLELGNRIATRGKEAVPFLLSVLREANDDLDVRDAVYVLYAMDGLGAYRVSGDRDLIASIEASLQRMKPGPWMDSSRKMLNEMQSRK